MAVHQSNPDTAPDEEFQDGELAFLVEGNTCRLTDARRTPGLIEKCWIDRAMFRWRIQDFEDEGKFWDLPFEEVSRMQFPPEASRRTAIEVFALEEAIRHFRKPLRLKVNARAAQESEQQIEAYSQSTMKWLEQEGSFFPQGGTLALDAPEGPEALADDLEAYMKGQGLAEQERRTAFALVLNPNVGEWFKGMRITLAHLGLHPFEGSVTRTPDVFQGAGEPSLRRRYLLHRLGFVRAVFRMAEIHEVALFRGMKTEGFWGHRPPQAGSSWTFQSAVAASFSDFQAKSHFRHAYMLKRTFPIEQLWMTYLETRAMNQQYKEAEALVLLSEHDLRLW